MSDPQSTESDAPEGARMMLEPDALHDSEDEPYLDCPSCGSPATVTQIVEEGRCSSYLNEEATESGAQEVQNVDCSAKLSLELVWEDEE